MLRMIHEDGGNVDKYIAMAKDRKSSFRLMGFGHRVYKNFDPRAKIIKKACDAVLNKLGIHDPLLDIARQLEERALGDDYFVQHRLYPNVDFYSGIIYKAIGIPTNMFTVMFAVGRLPGWIAQWKEMVESGDTKIGRPARSTPAKHRATTFLSPSAADEVPLPDGFHRGCPPFEPWLPLRVGAASAPRGLRKSGDIIFRGNAR